MTTAMSSGVKTSRPDKSALLAEQRSPLMPRSDNIQLSTVGETITTTTTTTTKKKGNRVGSPTSPSSSPPTTQALPSSHVVAVASNAPLNAVRISTMSLSSSSSANGIFPDDDDDDVDDIVDDSSFSVGDDDDDDDAVDSDDESSGNNNHRPLARASTDPTCYSVTSSLGTTTTTTTTMVPGDGDDDDHGVAQSWQQKQQHGKYQSGAYAPLPSSTSAAAAQTSAAPLGYVLKPTVRAVRSSPLESVSEKQPGGDDNAIAAPTPTDDDDVTASGQHRLVERSGSRGERIRRRLSRTLSMFSRQDVVAAASAGTDPSSSTTAAAALATAPDTPSRPSSAATSQPVASPTKTPTAGSRLVRRLTRSFSDVTQRRPEAWNRQRREQRRQQHRRRRLESDDVSPDDDVVAAAAVARDDIIAMTTTSSAAAAGSTPSRRHTRRSSLYGGEGTALGQSPSPVSPFGMPSTYTKLSVIGEGSYATVFKGRSSRLNAIVALKEITLNPEEGAPFTAIREASLLKGLKHANIIILHDIIHTPTKLTFVFELLDTDLSRYMEGHAAKGLSSDTTRLFLYQLVRGLRYVHARKILHRDLKPQNLLISRGGELKLADFGLARAKSVPSHTYTHEVVTVWYRPPDVLLGSRTYNASIDMWGVGCIFLEMLSGAPLFPGLNDVHDQLVNIFKVMGTPTAATWSEFPRLPHAGTPFDSYARLKLRTVVPRLASEPGAEHLADRLLRMNPAERLSAAEALAHPYFAGIPTSVARLPVTASIYETGQLRFGGGDAVVFRRSASGGGGGGLAEGDGGDGDDAAGSYGSDSR